MNRRVCKCGQVLLYGAEHLNCPMGTPVVRPARNKPRVILQAAETMGMTELGGWKGPLYRVVLVHPGRELWIHRYRRATNWDTTPQSAWTAGERMLAKHA